MDIHAPMEPIHSWRDIALHLGIITIGLLIALSLEGFVEYLHHRHLVAEASSTIRQELEENHKAAQDDLGRLQKNIDLQEANIKAIHSLHDHPKGFHVSISNTMSFNSMEDAAWRTARDTGALSFMPYDEVQRYSDLYMLAGIVNDHAVTTGTADFAAAAPFKMGFEADALPPEEYIRMLHENAAVEIDLVTLKQFVQQLDDMTVAELKK
jgi:hypothetical protein